MELISMIPDSFPVELVSWDYAHALSRNLAGLITASRFRPELVIAIGRGGFVPARIVCDYLLMTDLTSIRIEHWGKAASRYAEAKVRFPLSVDVSGKDLLVIDDITDTGETLAVAREYLASLNPGEVRWGVLQHKTTSMIQPDYYAELITDWRWIVYPWAIHEDLTGFMEKVMTEAPASPDDLMDNLQTRFSVIPEKEMVSEALDHLVLMGRAVRKGTRYRLLRNTSPATR